MIISNDDEINLIDAIEKKNIKNEFNIKKFNKKKKKIKKKKKKKILIMNK